MTIFDEWSRWEATGQLDPVDQVVAIDPATPDDGAVVASRKADGGIVYFNEYRELRAPADFVIPPRAVHHGDAVGVDMPKPGVFDVMIKGTEAVRRSLTDMVAAWSKSVEKAGGFLQAMMQSRHRQWHHFVGLLTDNSKIRRRYKQCRICRPYSNPAPIPRGRGAEYARRRRHR